MRSAAEVGHAPSPVQVTGGADGLTAHLDQLDVLARRFGEAATDCLGAAAALHAYLAHPALLGSAVLDPAGFGAFELELTAALDGPGGLSWAGARCGLLDGDIRLAAATYRDVDRVDTRLRDVVTGIRYLPAAIAAGGAALVRTGDPGTAAQRALTRDPALAGGLVDALGVPAAVGAAAAVSPDGRGVARVTGFDRGGPAARPPRSLPDLVAELARRNDDPRHGAVDVRIIALPDGTRRVVVDITGTKSWNPGPTRDVTSLSTNERALVGRSGAYEQGVLEAMQRAGVRPQDEVMLVGHSEGGAVAITTARDAVRSGRFRVTHVVTAGSPIGRTAGEVPASVQVLALENGRDVVPHLDGVANPDRPNVTTATGDHGDGTVLDDHGLEHGYLPLAEDVAASNDPSVRAFLRSADGFFAGSSVTTQTFQVVRSP